MKYGVNMLGLLMLIACNDRPVPKAAESADTTRKSAGSDVMPGTRTCYTNYKNRDTVLLSVSIKDTAITGDLIYSVYQKDRNRGTLSGLVRGDTLIADYRFNSEGSESVRQVIFLKRGNKLVEGFGDLIEESGRMLFSNRSALVFDSSLVLTLTDCSSLPAVH